MPPFADEIGMDQVIVEGAKGQVQNPKPRKQGWQKEEAKALESLEEGEKMRQMEVVRRKLGISNDLTEMYSPWRVNEVIKELKMRPGFSLDLTVPGPDGKAWDFSKPSDRLKLWKLIYKHRPYFVIGSPPCTVYSALQNYRRSRPGGEERLARAKLAAQKHLEFCCEVYAHQVRQGLYFVHEHPS